MIGLDTTVLIDIHKKDPHVFEKLEELEEEFILNDLIYLELTVGINTQKETHKKEQALYDEYFDTLTTIALSKTAAKKTRDIIWQAKKQQKTIHLLDATIAGIYLANNVKKILTRNKKDFENIPELDVITY